MIATRIRRLPPVGAPPHASRVQDIPQPQPDAAEHFKTVGTIAGAVLGVAAVWGKVSSGVRSLRSFCRDFAALPRRARETHAIVLGHERMLELLLSASATASFHSDSHGRLVKSSGEFDRLMTVGDVALRSRSWRDLFLREEREEIARRWDEAVTSRVEFAFEGHIQPDENRVPLRVRIKAVPLEHEQPDGGLWFGIIREAS